MKKPAKFKFQLFVAGDSPNSMQALANLKAICRTHLAGRHEIEVVDIFEEPILMMAYTIYITPTLLVHKPAPLRRIIGSLSQTQVVLQTLGIESSEA